MDDADNAGPADLLSGSSDGNWFRKLQSWHRLGSRATIVWLIGLEEQHRDLKKWWGQWSITDSPQKGWKVQFRQFARNEWRPCPMWCGLPNREKTGQLCQISQYPTCIGNFHIRDVQSFIFLPVYNDEYISMSGRMMDPGINGGNSGFADLISNLILLSLIREWDLSRDTTHPYSLMCSHDLFLLFTVLKWRLSIFSFLDH